MVQITPYLAIAESEIQEEFVRSSGAGGQNVKIVATVKGNSMAIREAWQEKREVSA